MAQLVTRRPSIFARIKNMVGVWRDSKRPFLSWFVGSQEIFPILGTEEAIRKGYARNSAIFTIINKDAAKFAMVPRYVYDLKAKESEKGTLVKMSTGKAAALTQLLREPNPEQTQSEFFEGARIMYKSSSETFIWLNRGDTRQGVNNMGELYDRSDEEQDRMPVIEMYVLPSQFVIVVPDSNNVFGAAGYWFEVNGTRKWVRKGDMIHWKSFNPLFDFSDGKHLRGLNALEVGSCDVAEFNAIAKSNLRQHQNDGAKGILTNNSMDWAAMTDEQKEQMREKVNSRLNGADVRDAIAMLGGAEWDYHAIAASSRDMQTLESKKFKWHELCFMLDVPPGLFANDSKYNNAPEYQKQWVYNSIIPQCQRLDQKLTKKLCKAFGLEGTAEIYSDYMALPELQRNLTELSQAFNNMWYVTPNQKLIACGFEPNPSPLFNEPWVGMGMTPLSQYGKEQTFQDESDKLEDDEY